MKKPAFSKLHRVVPFALGLFFLFSDAKAQSTYARIYTFKTLAGVVSGPGSIDGTGAGARFDHPSNLGEDAAGNLYVADTNNNTVRKITSAGVVTTFAGLPGASGSSDGTGSAARFNGPTGVTVDVDGNVFVADTNNNTIRKITPAGAVTTLAGAPGISGATDGTGSLARFSSPFALAVDGGGNVFVADTSNQTIRKISPGGAVTTFAGAANSAGSADGSGSLARFDYPTGIAVDSLGNVFVADSFNQTVRKITSGGVVTTLAGTVGIAGSADGTGTAAQFNFPTSITADGAGNCYVADTNSNTVREITPGGVVTTLAGSAGSSGSIDATGHAARFFAPAGAVVDSSGNVFISDTSNDTIRRISAAGVVTTIAGAAVYGSADGTGGAARFTLPVGTAVDGSGNIYVADGGNDTIRKITPSGVVSTLAGMPGVVGAIDGTGSSARFNKPTGVALDTSGNLYVGDAGNALIRKISPAGVVTTLAGSAGSTGSADGTGSAARFSYPSGMAVDAAGYVYVADAAAETIRRITPSGQVTTLAGSFGNVGSTDGGGSSARFNYPSGVAVDASGNVYVADAGNQAIRLISPNGTVTTIAGMAGSVGSADGIGSAARFNSPSSLAVDQAGNVFVADTNNETIRQITSTGMVTTLAGLASVSGSVDATGSGVRFDLPHGVAVGPSGILYVADTYNNTIRSGQVAHIVAHDFNADGKPDILWENTVTGDRSFWLMNGTDIASFAYLAGIPTDWHIAGTADFNGDGQPDIVWENRVSGDRTVWFMNGTVLVGSAYLANIPGEWRIAAVGDFNGDGSPDLLWENTATGDRSFWLMNGTTISSMVYLAGIPTEWKIAGAADFNGDGKLDLVWENSATGVRTVWLMNGTSILDFAYLATIPTEWHIAATGDFNGDGKPDLVWEDTVTGDRAIWLMDGTSQTASAYLANVATSWRITP